MLLLKLEKHSAKRTGSLGLFCSLLDIRKPAQKEVGFCFNAGISAQLFTYLLIICSSNPQTRSRAGQGINLAEKKVNL